MTRRRQEGRNRYYYHHHHRPLQVTFDLSRGRLISTMTGDGSSQNGGGRPTAGLLAVPKVVSIRELANQIANDEMHSLRLHGFDHAHNFTERDMQILCQALEANTSLVEVKMSWTTIQGISVGLLLEKVAALPNLTRLSLKTFTWITEESMKTILRSQSLQELECQGVWVRTADGGRQTVVESLLLEAANGATIQKYMNITKLRFIHCSLRDEDCEKLKRFSHLYCSGGDGLQELSLQGNRFITGIGMSSLVQAKVIRLDMTECGISNADLSTMLSQRVVLGPTTTIGDDFFFGLEELILARNERISMPDRASFLQFAGFCITRLKLLDLSKCRIGDDELLSILLMLQADTCRLESFLCEGSFSIPVHAIAQTLIKNRTLSSIVLNTCRDECYNSHFDQHRTFLVESLKMNYNLHSLEINCCGNNMIMLEYNEFAEFCGGNEASPDPTRREIDFLLRLNRAGRKVLLDDGSAGNPVVLREVLKKTALQGDDVLFWFLQNGLSTHFRNNKTAQ